MKKIGQVFLYDISHIKKNVIAMIVVLGLCVVPSLYAWFNIAASWDPYSNTNGLKVAVANTDEGYEGEILPLQINIGDTVISSLRENDQLDWTFTGKKDAVEGVKSGKYYAAIVIPKSFSQDMMSLFSEEMTHSDIIYCINEKENAIAPKVTDKGASAVQQQIDEIFVKTAAQVGLDLLDTISEVTSSDGAQAAAQNLTENIRKIGSDLDSTAGTVKAFSNMTVSMQQMLDATADILNKAGQNTETNLSLLNETGNSVDSLRSAVSGTTESVNQVLAQGSQCYDAISGQINNAFSLISTDAGATAGALNSVASEVQVMIDRYTGFRDSVQQLADSFPLASDLLQPIIGNLNESIAHQEAVRDKLNEAAAKITETASDAGNYQAQLDQLVQQSSQQISGIRSDYENNVKTQIDTMFGTLGDTSSAVQSLFTSMDNGVEDMEKLAKGCRIRSGEDENNTGYICFPFDRDGRKGKPGSRKAGYGSTGRKCGDIKKCAWKQPGSNQQFCVCAGKNADKSLVSGRKLWISHGAVLFYTLYLGRRDHPGSNDESDSFGKFKKSACAIEAASDLSGQIPAVPRAGTDPERPDLSGRSVFPWNPV